jgi:hypothetical protein
VAKLVVGIKHCPSDGANALDSKTASNTFDLGMLERMNLTDEI